MSGHSALYDLIQRAMQIKRRVFVSYHHRGDQAFYDAFRRQFDLTYDIVHDSSLDRQIESDNTDYVMQRIRDNHISGSSCTIVLCGGETWLRKYVDWEIKATLDKQHGIIGVSLFAPGVQPIWPERLFDNILSGYAVTSTWAAIIQQPASLALLIEAANSKSKQLIDNRRAMMSRNRG